MYKTLCFTLIALILTGCVGNKAETEVTGIKIERKPSVSEEAQGWADAVNTLLGKDGE